MKGIVLDENVPRSLSLPTSLVVRHVLDFGDTLTDSEVWSIARREELVIVSKDADFRHRILLANPPPWIVHLRLGNLRYEALCRQVVSVWSQIESELPRAKLVSVFNDRIEMTR
jgi:predicted nuclease of predicted toxin-antitoxin system